MSNVLFSIFIMTIYETLKKDRKINNDFDYKRAKVELQKLAKTYNVCGNGPVDKMQLFSDSISEYEQLTMSCFLENKDILDT